MDKGKIVELKIKLKETEEKLSSQLWDFSLKWRKSKRNLLKV